MIRPAAAAVGPRKDRAMLHVPIILGVKVAAAVYRSRARAQAARSASGSASSAGPKPEHQGTDAVLNRGDHHG